jgi:tetratricopeptide (TPR) repeat protein
MVIRSLEHEARLWQEKRERASVLAQIGEVYEKRLGDIDQAISYYEGALAIDPRCVPATRALLDIYFDRQDWRQAAPLAKALNARALRDLPPADKAELFGKRAVVARQLGNLDEAFASLTIALEFDPFNANCLAELITCVKAGMTGHDRELDELIEHLKQAYTEKNEQPALGLLAWLRGVMVERRGNLGLGEALDIYKGAVTMAPDHAGPSFALAEMLGRLRQWQESAQVLERFLARRPPRQDAIGAYLRLGDIWSEGAMDAPAAIAAYRKLLTIDPENREALYRISQDYYVSGRWADARMNMERLVALNERTTPPVPPPTVARHVYYLGRILQEGFRAYDQAEARYRKAIELDGTFHTAYIALARSMMARGDRQNAITFLTDAVRRVGERDGTPAAIPLQRGLANLLRRVGEPAQAEREYRKLISLNPSTNGVADRVTLAELYLQELSNEQAATQTAMAALEREPLYPPAFRLLISIYAKTAENDRVFALLSLLEATGDVEDVEKTYLDDLRSRVRLFTEPRGALNDDLRARYMVTPQVLGAFTELWQSVREVFERPFLKQIETNPPPATDHFTRSATPPLRQLISSVLRISAVDADVYVKRDATYLARCDVGPKPIVFLGPAFASHLNDGERRFILGKYLELIRLGVPLLMRMETAEANATLERVRELLSPDAERSPVAREIMRNLPRKNLKRVTEVVQMAAQSLIPAPAEWLDALERTSDRAGLIAAGEVAPCLAAMSKLAGRPVEATPGGGRALLAVEGGIPLIHYQLSDDHFSLRRAIGAWR